MAKNARQIRDTIKEPRAKRSFAASSRSTHEGQTSLAVSSGSDEEVGRQVYSSDAQALEVLVRSIVGKVSDSPEGEREMAEFLHTVLDTDPTLRQEILAGISVRK
jgi:hypothetical protein